MCEVTGGRSYAVTSQRMLHQCIDSLVQKLQSGVVIHFEKIGPDPPQVAITKEDSMESTASTADTVILDNDRWDRYIFIFCGQKNLEKFKLKKIREITSHKWKELLISFMENNQKLIFMKLIFFISRIFLPRYDGIV